jgi:hypothetical protein
MPLEPQAEAALLNWAIDHFGSDCAPRISDKDDHIIVSITNPKTGDRYHMAVKSIRSRFFLDTGATTVDRVH